MGGFFSGVMSSVSPRIEEQHRIDQERKSQERQGYLTAATNAARIAYGPPDSVDPLTGQPYTPEKRKQADADYQNFWAQYQKFAGGPKILKDLFGKVNTVLQHVHGGANQPGQPTAAPGGGGQPAGLGPEATDASGAAAPPQSSIPPPPSASAAPAASPATIPPPPGDVRGRALAYASPQAPSAEAMAVTSANAAAAGHGALLKKLDSALAAIDADPNLDDDQKSEKRRVTTLSYGLQPRTQLRESTALTKGADIPDYEAKGLKPDLYYRRMFNPVNGDTISYHPASAPMGQIRAINSPITPESAREAATQGKKFLDESGKEIDVAALKPFQKLTPVETNRGVHYIVGNQASRYVTVGNQVHELPALGQIGIPGQAPPVGVTAVGPKQVPVNSTREVVAVDANGNPVKQVLSSTRTPMTSGGGRLTAPPGSPGTAPAAGGGARVPGATPKPAGGSPAFATPALWNTQAGKVTPVRAAAIQLIGSPETPDFKPLESYAPLADDSGARERVANAWRFMVDDLSKTEKTHGPLGTIISNYGGLTNLLASSQSAATQASLAKLKPEEKDLLDREIAAYGSIIGLRSLTKASAAQFSAKSIERELPILGVNTNSSRQFYNKLSSLFEEIVSGSKNIGDSFMPEKKQYQAAATRLAKLAGGGASRLAPPPGGATPKMIRARDPKGNLHEAPAGSSLPKGWKLEP